MYFVPSLSIIGPVVLKKKTKCKKSKWQWQQMEKFDQNSLLELATKLKVIVCQNLLSLTSVEKLCLHPFFWKVWSGYERSCKISLSRIIIIPAHKFREIWFQMLPIIYNSLLLFKASYLNATFVPVSWKLSN